MPLQARKLIFFHRKNGIEKKEEGEKEEEEGEEEEESRKRHIHTH